MAHSRAPVVLTQGDALMRKMLTIILGVSNSRDFRGRTGKIGVNESPEC